MELFPALTTFFKSIADDNRISSTHISLYTALLQEYNTNGGNSCLQITRTQIMKTAKFSSRKTYNKCLKDLRDFKYITYKPAVNASTKSEISLKAL